MARRSKRNMIVPPLSDDPRDTGDRYMVQMHRKLMAEYFGVDLKTEFPKGLDPQRQYLKMLKASDVEKYNKAFDIIVRKKEPEQEKAEVNSVEIPDDLMDKVHEKVEESLKEFDDHVNHKKDSVAETLTSLRDNIESAIQEEIKKQSKVFNKVTYEVKTAKNKKAKEIKGTLPEEFQKILDLASQRLNILLVGPSGCGKTHIAKTVADSLELDFASQSCSAGMSETAFSGWLLPIGAGGKFEYVSSEFIRIYENGGVFLFDEIDAADSNTMLFLNQALANGEFHLPQRHKKPKVTKHPDFVAIAAANTYGNGANAMYSGRNIMDGATMDRFRMGIVPMDYSPAVEGELVDPTVLEWGKLVRNIIERKSLRKIMSTRLLIDATKMKSIGWTLRDIANSYFADWSKEERFMAERDFDLQEFMVRVEPVEGGE